MFCTTLRKRPDLSSVLPLLTSCTSPNLRETSLQTHDLALPNLHSSYNHQFLFLLLSPSSLATPQPQLLERITRFSSLTASPTPIIAFLLNTNTATPSNSTSENGMHAYMTLQTLIHTLPHALPLLPISQPSTLLPSLLTYTTVPPPPAPAPTISPLHLLPHITSTAPARPLATHTTNILSDICHSLKEVIALTETEGGRKELGGWVGEEEAAGLVEFWEGEWICE